MSEDSRFGDFVAEVAKRLGIDRGVAKRLGIDRGVAKRLGIDREVAKRLGIDREVAKRLGIDREVAKRLGIDRGVAKRLGIDRGVAKRLGIDRGVAKRLGIDRGVAKRLGIDREVAKRLGIDREVAKRLGIDREVGETLRNRPGGGETLRNRPGGGETLRNRPEGGETLRNRPRRGETVTEERDLGGADRLRVRAPATGKVAIGNAGVILPPGFAAGSGCAPARATADLEVGGVGWWGAQSGRLHFSGARAPGRWRWPAATEARRGCRGGRDRNSASVPRGRRSATRAFSGPGIPPDRANGDAPDSVGPGRARAA